MYETEITIRVKVVGDPRVRAEMHATKVRSEALTRLTRLPGVVSVLTEIEEKN